MTALVALLLAAITVIVGLELRDWRRDRNSYALGTAAIAAGIAAALIWAAFLYHSP